MVLPGPTGLDGAARSVANCPENRARDTRTRVFSAESRSGAAPGGASGALRASFVPRVLPSALATLLDPGKPSSTSPLMGDSVWDADIRTPSPLTFDSFEAELLKPDAGPACGSRPSVNTLPDGCSTRSNLWVPGSPPAEQLSVLGGWLDVSIRYFRFKPQRSGLQA